MCAEYSEVWGRRTKGLRGAVPVINRRSFAIVAETVRSWCGDPGNDFGIIHTTHLSGRPLGTAADTTNSAFQSSFLARYPQMQYEYGERMTWQTLNARAVSKSTTNSFDLHEALSSMYMRRSALLSR
jgi:hypothetical protein